MPAGTDTIDSVIIADKAGNVHYYYQSDLAALGLPTAITFTGGSSDATPPILSGLTFPSTVDLSGGNQVVTFSTTATDDASGVSWSQIRFNKPIQPSTRMAARTVRISYGHSTA